ncbi:MAG: hypothetical protein ACOCQX_04405 [Candidatus Nanoarchaeia archaeon]
MVDFANLEKTLQDITKIVSESNPNTQSLYDNLKDFYKKVAPIESNKLRTTINIGALTHNTQKRYTGEPFFAHPCRAAYIAGSLTGKADCVYINLLHDAIEDSESCDKTRWDIFQNLGLDIFLGVSGMGTLKNTPGPHEKATIQYKRIQYFHNQHRINLEPTKIGDVWDNLLTVEHLPQTKELNAAQRQDAYCQVARKYVLPMCKRFDTTHKNKKITPYFENLLSTKERQIYINS